MRKRTYYKITNDRYLIAVRRKKAKPGELLYPTKDAALKAIREGYRDRYFEYWTTERRIDRDIEVIPRELEYLEITNKEQEETTKEEEPTPDKPPGMPTLLGMTRILKDTSPEVANFLDFDKLNIKNVTVKKVRLNGK